MPRRSTRRHATLSVAVLPVAALALSALAVVPAAASTRGRLAPATSSSTSTSTAKSSNTGANPAKPSAGTEYAAAIKAARAKGVHFVSIATEGGTTIHVVGDTGLTSGAQTITVKRGSVVEHVHAVVVGATGYVNGNNAALRNVIGLTPAQSSKYAGRWMSFPTSNTALDSLVGGLLDKDVASELQMHGPYTYAPSTTIGGQRAIGIRGSVPSQSGKAEPQVLYIPASGAALPMEEVTNPGQAKGSSAIHGTVSFSSLGPEEVREGARALGLVAQARPAVVGQLDHDEPEGLTRGSKA